MAKSIHRGAAAAAALVLAVFLGIAADLAMAQAQRRQNPSSGGISGTEGYRSDWSRPPGGGWREPGAAVRDPIRDGRNDRLSCPDPARRDGSGRCSR